MIQDRMQRDDVSGPHRLRRLGRISGGLYLALALLGFCSPLLLESTVVPGDAAATAAAIRDSQGLFAASLVGWAAIVVVDTSLAVTFYVLLRRTDRILALLAAALRVLYAAMLAALLPRLFEAYRLLTMGAADPEAGVDNRAFVDIEAFRTGFLLAIVFFGVHLVLLGHLLYRSGLIPRAIGALVAAAGVAYLIDSFGSLLVADYGGALAAGLIAVVLIGELALVGWLLIRGVTPREASLSGR